MPSCSNGQPTPVLNQNSEGKSQNVALRDSIYATVLIIASDFPPLIGTNTQRIQSFVRHLPTFGWFPSVVTQAIEDLDRIDSRELARIPDDMPLFRITNPDPFAARRRMMKIMPADAAFPSDVASTVASGAIKLSNQQRGRFSRWFKTIASVSLKAALRAFLYHPDALRPWANAVAHTVLQNGHATRHQAMLTSCPTYSTHVAGLKIKRITGIPWIADFRDLWLDRPFRKTPSSLHDWMDRRLETAVVQSCDALILASPAWETVFLERYGYQIKDKMITITNGYEEAYIERLRTELSPRQDGNRRFVLTGAMRSAESPAPFLQALTRLREARPDLVRNVEVCFIGSAGDELARLQHLAQSAGLQDQVQFLSPRSNEECLRKQLEADFLLLFIAHEHQDTICGKSFEYLAVGKPILACIPPDGIQADILRRAGTALIVPYGDLVATQNAIERLLTTGGDGLNPNVTYIQQYEREALTNRLATVLDHITTSEHRSSQRK